MTSKYSQKQNRAACAVTADCPDPGTVLTMLRGRPEWVCGRHFKQIQQAR